MSKNRGYSFTSTMSFPVACYYRHSQWRSITESHRISLATTPCSLSPIGDTNRTSRLMSCGRCTVYPANLHPATKSGNINTLSYLQRRYHIGFPEPIHHHCTSRVAVSSALLRTGLLHRSWARCCSLFDGSHVPADPRNYGGNAAGELTVVHSCLSLSHPT